MRKEIQYDAGSYSEFFTQQKGVGEVAQRLVLRNHDQFVYASPFEQLSNVSLLKDSNQLESPNSVFVDFSAEVPGGFTRSDHRHMTDIESAMLFQSDDHKSISNKQSVV